MATYAIGDIHGCWLTLQRLLDRIEWRPGSDRLWLVGDMVNRGPSSLEVLRWAYENRDHLTAVLGNHDLHLLARAAALRSKPDDSLDEVLEAPDREPLLHWLRRRPLLHLEGESLLVHAGLWPGWELDEAVDLAGEVGEVLADDDGVVMLYGARKTRWREDLEGFERLAAALGIFTMVRVVDRASGNTRLGFTGSPDTAPEGCRPWFETSRVVAGGTRVIFGHWAMLGQHSHGTAICLDSGCHWGGSLTALRLDDGWLFAEPVVDDERWAGWQGAAQGVEAGDG